MILSICFHRAANLEQKLNNKFNPYSRLKVKLFAYNDSLRAFWDVYSSVFHTQRTNNLQGSVLLWGLRYCESFSSLIFCIKRVILWLCFTEISRDSSTAVYTLRIEQWLIFMLLTSCFLLSLKIEWAQAQYSFKQI